MSKRRVRSDELQLWRKVADQATPLDPKRAIEPLQDSGTQPVAPKRMPLPSAPSTQTSTAAVQSGKPALNMDKKAFQRLKRGKLVPEARLDLHGMTLARAHPALIQFIHSAHSAGCRLLLVITGKGKSGADDGPIPRRVGALRHDVPHWLHSAPLSPMVQQVVQAHPRHGGSGAYYVYLRRRRE